MKVLVVDIGGSHIKFAVPGKKLERSEVSSGKEMTPAKMLKKSFGEILGKPASKEDRRKWEAAVHEAVGEVARAFSADYVVIGGGNARRLKHLPACARRGSNKNAFKGGVRLWTDAVHKKHTLVIR